MLSELKDEINGLNLYIYCLNNPVNTFDDDGHLAWWKKLLIGLAVIVVLALVTIATAGAAGIGIGAAFVAGFTGASLGTGIGATITGIAASAFAGALVGAVVSSVGGAVSGYISTGTLEGTLNGLGDGFMWGSVSGAISGALGGIKFTYGNFGPNDIGNVFRTAATTIVSVGTYLGRTYANKEKPSILGVALSIFGGVSGGLLSQTGFSNSLFVTAGMEIIDVVRAYMKSISKTEFTELLLRR